MSLSWFGQHSRQHSRCWFTEQGNLPSLTLFLLSHVLVLRWASDHIMLAAPYRKDSALNGPHRHRMQEQDSALITKPRYSEDIFPKPDSMR